MEPMKTVESYMYVLAESHKVPCIDVKVAQSILVCGEKHGRIPAENSADLPNIMPFDLLWIILKFSKSESAVMSEKESG
ncbi:hypothetical protein DPMN_066250 [Dreissena polymorpha]|uniref:Uncharacterized protein n=1 Tax=Dreissena polymorpha TaxID=45954 RepID=A0A9D3YT49_DREPO|nr:hypothetical protein DPMN_066250 [Dreissena polymorpha]